MSRLRNHISFLPAIVLWAVVSMPGCGPRDAPAPAADGSTGAGAAADVIRQYYADINAGRLLRAYESWGNGGAASGQTYEQFAAGFASTAEVAVDLGEAGRVEGAVGSRHIRIPVTIRAVTVSGDSQLFRGAYTLRRSVVDGASSEQRRWHIYTAEIDPIEDGERGDTLVMQAAAQVARRPEAPLRVLGACPFECCTYGTWTTTEATDVHAEPDSGAAVRFSVPPGTPLEAATGFVLITQIGLAVARDSVPIYRETGDFRTIPPGDTLLLLDAIGEGFRRTWYGDSIYQADTGALEMDGRTSELELLREPRQEWWARVRAADGRSGWLWMDHTPLMKGADACGG